MADREMWEEYAERLNAKYDRLIVGTPGRSLFPPGPDPVEQVRDVEVDEDRDDADECRWLR